MTHIVMCAKSPWLPNIRREHALSVALATAGVSVTFVERPRDIRSLTGHGATRSFVRTLYGRDSPAAPADGVRVVPRSVVLPGHLHASARRLDLHGLRSTLRRDRLAVGAPSAVVVNTPWQWGCGARRGVRQVADLADDWRELVPHRRAAMDLLLKRIEDEADEIVVASGDLARCFARPVTVVPNAAADDLFATPVTSPPKRRRIVYVGTLSERFDATLMSAVMTSLPGWTLDLYGQCQYRRGGDQPDEQLRALLDGHDGRVRWQGLVARQDLAATLDAADVLVLPNRVDLTAGQDSMKLYDYASRGRPIVATTRNAAAAGLPGLVVAETADRFAAAIDAAAADPFDLPPRRRAWAESHRWSRRVAPWLHAVLGEAVPSCG